MKDDTIKCSFTSSEMIHASSYKDEDWAFHEQRLLSEALAQDLMFRRMWGSRTGEAALPPVPSVHYGHHKGWSLSHLWLAIKWNNKAEQREAVNYFLLFSTVFTLLVSEYSHLDIPGVKQNKCCNLQLCPAIFLRPRSLPCDIQAALSTRAFENICSYGKAKN